MNKKFPDLDKAVLAAFGMSEETMQHLESIGINNKQAIVDTGGGEKLSTISGIDSNLATNIFAWASLIGFDDDNEENASVETTFAIDFSEPIPYTIEDYSTYKFWVEAAEANDELDGEHIEEVKTYYDNLVAGLNEDPEDANSVYNFARTLLVLTDPAIGKTSNNETISKEAISLIKTAEAYFKKAIEMFDGFGRARIMYASLLCGQQRFKEAIEIVEPALSLPEGSEDWMIAARWYLTAKASLNDTFGEVAVTYQKYKEYAVEGSSHHIFIQNALCNYF